MEKRKLSWDNISFEIGWALGKIKKFFTKERMDKIKKAIPAVRVYLIILLLFLVLISFSRKDTRDIYNYTYNIDGASAICLTEGAVRVECTQYDENSNPICTINIY